MVGTRNFQTASVRKFLATLFRKINDLHILPASNQYSALTEL